MSILIEGMEMPKSCLECPLTDGHSAVCLITEKSVYFSVDKRHDGCPLIEVPEPHGRLIDADAMCEGRVRNDNVVICAKCAPTIIPASEESMI